MLACCPRARTHLERGDLCIQRVDVLLVCPELVRLWQLRAELRNLSLDIVGGVAPAGLGRCLHLLLVRLPARLLVDEEGVLWVRQQRGACNGSARPPTVSAIGWRQPIRAGESAPFTFIGTGRYCPKPPAKFEKSFDPSELSRDAGRDMLPPASPLRA